MSLDDTADALRGVLTRAPLGFELARSDGEVIFSNRAAGGRALNDAPDKSPASHTEQFHVEFNGQSYQLALSFCNAQRKSLEDELFRKAYFDDLTGLPNRALFERTITTFMEETSEPFALAFIDLDGFKYINDYYGHAAGDELLIKTAQRLSANLRPTDMLARLSGDEFVLLLSPLGEPGELQKRLRDISDKQKAPFYIDGYEMLSSASIGVGIFPDHGARYDALRANADSAMYRCKASTKGGVRFFDPTVQHAAAERTRLEQRLRLAIRDKRICCAFQPKVDFRSDTVVGVEALLRWRDEEGMIHPPSDFVTLAIELGLMDDVTRLVLGEVIESMDRIDAAFGPQVSVSVNVAAKQAEDARLMRSILETIDATGYAPRFMLELTEEAFFAKSQFQSRILPMIRETGAKVSIDDFGVGYSSLSALADITADEIKVDRSFVTDLHKRPRSQSVLKAIESLGQSLGMGVVVEGVETFEELAYLQAATRINVAQGYYFCKPVLLDDLSNQDQGGELARSDAPARGASIARAAAAGRDMFVRRA